MILEDTDNLDDSKKKIQDTLVSTLDTVRYKYIMDLCIQQNRLRSFLFIALPVVMCKYSNGVMWFTLLSSDLGKLYIRFIVKTSHSQNVPSSKRYKSRISKISETNFLNFEKIVISLTKNFINFAISICVYDYSTLGD